MLNRKIEDNKQRKILMWMVIKYKEVEDKENISLQLDDAKS